MKERRRRRAHYLVAGVLATTLSTPVDVAAQDAEHKGFVTAADLYRDCHPVSTENPAQVVAYVKCIGYIDGAASMARIYTLTFKLNELCIPPGTMNIQIVDVVMGFIAANQSVSDAQGSIAVYAALRDAYPCSQ